MDKGSINKQIQELETRMASPDFWSDKDKAQEVIRELQDLKSELEVPASTIREVRL